ncbi:DUF2163 domain-containing protein [Actibacterium sp. 188UL27-1]|uniref:DUF2163 domain-containing protein n=1 Tax=Actibacterium sp. 188UL27-1 TaxID=2786961 RepID=UPI00195CD2A0|nr:DUF2163 domain-containing protein [Actibacterium sp. 188UL27-1]MBM7068030.1 DUF2163 domain-containing protein [Actibacterium sp. 188UL27-1]
MSAAGLHTHLATGHTTVCRCWAITRRDGRRFGFTDHDLPLEFDGIIFNADTGLTAKALAQSTGLSVDNTEALGALSDASVTEADILAGRFDEAEVVAWLVNWAAPAERVVQFRGSIGEVSRGSGAFTAELRGLTEALNKPNGRVYQKPCSAVLGDGQCGFDLETPGYAAEAEVMQVTDARVFQLSGLDGFAAGWFDRGRLEISTGAAAGLSGLIKSDEADNGLRQIAVWQELQAEIAVGDRVRVEAGCDRRAVTCRLKFDNYLNFRGFPDIPGEDWLMSYPSQARPNTGGSLKGDT